jgi:hypothetical protein
MADLVLLLADANRNSVIIIHIARHRFCFLQFDVSNDYIDQLFKGKTPSVFLPVWITRWFNVDNQPGREGIAKNMRHLIAMAKQQVSTK